jgi:hypothetical protein
MEPEGSLPGSHPTTDPYSVQHKSSSHHPILRCILILSRFRLGLPSGLFSLGFPMKSLYAVLFRLMRDESSAHLILPNLFIYIISRDECKS